MIRYTGMGELGRLRKPRASGDDPGDRPVG